jgi:outer membrane protein insertion porin family
MGGRIILGIIFCFWIQTSLLASPASGQGLVRVGVFPFQIFAADRTQANVWSQQVTKILFQELGKEERIILVEEEKMHAALTQWGRGETDEKAAREIGERVDADYVVTGSVTKVNGSWSLDARILAVNLPKLTASVFAAGREEGGLGTITSRLGRELSSKILKKEIIAKVMVEGNIAIEESAIRAQIKSKEGDFFSPQVVREDLKSIYQLGYFQDVRADRRDWDRGKALVFVVEEKPVVKGIQFQGNKAIKSSELQEAIDLKPRTVLKLNSVKESINKILQKYRDEA